MLATCLSTFLLSLSSTTAVTLVKKTGQTNTQRSVAFILNLCFLSELAEEADTFPTTLQGATTGGGRRGSGPPKIWTDHPNFFDEEYDYRYVTACSAQNWVYHPHFVLYNNLHQGVGPPTLKT